MACFYVNVNYNLTGLRLAFFIHKKYNEYERCVCYIMQIKAYYDFKLRFFDWLDNTLKNSVQDNIAALCFNLYECEDRHWKVELVATEKFDANNDDWACEVVCNLSQNHPFLWQEVSSENFKNIQSKVFVAAYEYLQTGKYAFELENKKCVAVGFVDSDLMPIYIAQKQKPFLSPYIFGAILSLIAAGAIYFIDVFCFENPYQHSFFRFIILCASIIVLFARLLFKEKRELSAIAKTYSEEIGIAFKYDKRSKTTLLKAIKDFTTQRHLKCVKRLNKIYNKAETIPDRQAVELFLALNCEETEDTENAIATYKAILQENPANLTALNNLAVIYSRNKDYENAIRIATNAVNIGQDPYAYNTLAVNYLKIFDFEKAKENAHIAFRLMPQLTESINSLAVACALSGDNEAEKYIDLAVRSGTKRVNIQSAIEKHKENYENHINKLKKVAAAVNHWKELTEKTSINISLSDIESKSIIGGSINEAAPLSHNGKRMKLLAAIFFSELPENEALPKNGVLRLYITPDEYYGVNFDDLDKLNIQNGFRVLFDENEDKFITSLEQDNSDKLFPITVCRFLSFTAVKECMSYSDFRFEETYNSIFTEDSKIKLTEDEKRKFEDRIDIFNHKLLGYPSFTQEDPRSIEIYKKYDTLLFQISDGTVMKEDEIIIGDAGVMQFFIPSEKLKNRDFSDILYTMDCY